MAATVPDPDTSTDLIDKMQVTTITGQKGRETARAAQPETIPDAVIPLGPQLKHHLKNLIQTQLLQTFLHGPTLYILIAEELLGKI